MSRKLFIPFLLLISPGALSQSAREYSFKHFSVVNGLASNLVNAVLQDREGFIWIATSNGLQRFDGSSFLTFRHHPGDSTAIPSNHIMVLYRDRKDRIWIVGNNNIAGRFDRHLFRFTAAGMPAEKRRYPMKQYFTETPDGKLLLHKEDGTLLQYIEGSNRFEAFREIPFPAGWRCIRILWDPGIRRYWLGCDSGLAQLNPATGLLNYRGHNPENDPVISAMGDLPWPADMITDSAGNLIFNYWNRITGPVQCRYNRQKGKAEYLGMPVGAYHEIFGYLKQRSGRIWTFGHPFFAEWKTAPKKFEFVLNGYRNEQSISYDYAYSAFEDREANIWISTDNGVFLFNPDAQVFNTYSLVRYADKSHEDLPVTTAGESADGKILIGAWGSGGIFSFDRNLNPVPLPSAIKMKNPSVWDMAMNPVTGELWITLQGGGIGVYHHKRNRYLEFYPEIFASSTIRQVDSDPLGNMWFGTQNGKVIKWDIRKSGADPRKGFEHFYSTGLVHKLLHDRQGALWVATLGHGLLKLDASTGKLLHQFTTSGSKSRKLFSDSPADLAIYDDSTILVAADCISIINTRTHNISHFTVDDGLPSNTALSIARDHAGIIWAGMLHGICRLNKDKKLVSYYDRRDGIPHDKFTLAGVKLLSDGRLVFLTDHNFLVFDPARFREQSIPPQPAITGFRLAGKALRVDSLLRDKRAVLRYNNTSFAISFSALSYLPQQKLHYYYMLNGLDRKWIRTDRPVEAVYHYLPPGKYRFMVKTVNADGQSADATATLLLVVRTPFWKSWWFYGLILLVAVLVFYIVDRERMKKLRQMQNLRTSIAGNLHQEINSTLSNINVLSRIAKIKAESNMEQSKEFIDQISDKSRNMMESMDDMLWSIHPENDSMRQTLFRIRQVTESLQADFETGIDLIVDNRLNLQRLDMKLRHELFFFYKEAMAFILQHSRGSQKFVNLNLVQKNLMLEILSECRPGDTLLREQFRHIMHPRVENMNASLEVTADRKTFAAVLVVNIR